MHFPAANGGSKNRFNISSVASRSTKPAVASFCAALSRTVLSLLLLIAFRSAAAQTETVVYNFCSEANCADGSGPDSRLVPDSNGNLYGTTRFGGAFGYGTVFELSPRKSGGWKETVLYSFGGGQNGPDGAYPWRFSNLVFDRLGNLYGTTAYGGANGLGTVFDLSREGHNWKETILHSFAGGTADGSYPLGDVAVDLAGNVYGTATADGPDGGGIIFDLSPSSSGWTEQVIYSNGLDNYGYNIYGVGIAAGVTMDSAGNIYGANADSVFELSPNGKGDWDATVLHTFAFSVSQGALDQGEVGTPVLAQDGNIYGTTIMGGPWGIVYKLSPEKNGKWRARAIHAFNGQQGHDGVASAGTLLVGGNGNIYGVSYGIGGQENAGDIFELTPRVGGVSYEAKLLWSFDGPPDGWLPTSGLMQDAAGNLYGTTALGGSNYGGIVFEISP